jgi:L-ornithine N5-oxygenase
MYMQRIQHPNEEHWPHQIWGNSNVVGVDTGDKSEIRLHIERSGSILSREFDAVILATGYARDMHEDFLAPARYLMPGGDTPEKVWEVERNYKVITEQGVVSDDAGIYLQGYCEPTHGVSSPTSPLHQPYANI